MKSMGLAALVAAMAVLVLAAPAGAAQKVPGRQIAVPKGHCVPPSGAYQTDRVIRLKSASRTEVTELMRGGVYRVTQCDAAGRLIRSQTVGRMKLKKGGVTPVILSSAKRSRGKVVSLTPVYAEPATAAEASAFRRKSIARALPQTRGTATQVGSGSLSTAGHGDDCHDGAYAYFGARVSGMEPYSIAVTTLPPGFNSDVIRQQYFAMRIVNGHDSWNFQTNGCGFEFRVNRWHSTYLGPTTLRANWPQGEGWDTQNVIDADF